MSRNILILGASYGSLLATKLAMAGHNVAMTCRARTAELINAEGTEVRIKLRGEDSHRAIKSTDLPGAVTALTPDVARPEDYDMIALAMQEPQYRAPEVAALMSRIAAAGKPCLSIMNMPPLPFLARIPGVDLDSLRSAYICPEVWKDFHPGLMSLCSPDPQAFRPPEEGANVLHVGLPTNFKACEFADPRHTKMLKDLSADINGVQIESKDVPVKLRVHDSLFTPLAKWAMLLTGNYRCITASTPRTIRDAVHDDLTVSTEIYTWVNALAQKLGAQPANQVPFEKYAGAASSLLKPSSAARAINAGAQSIERVDRLVQAVAAGFGLQHPEVDRIVTLVDHRLSTQAAQAA